MDDSLKIALVLSYGYLIGSVPTAYLAGRILRGIDIRRVGSGNVGASNVWYSVGQRWVVPIGAFDILVQGMSPPLIARAMGLEIEVQAAAGLLAVIGHNWSVFLRFEGGRGVAPALGVAMALARLELSVFLLVAVAGWRLTRGAALWVLVGFGTLPLLSLYWDRPTGVVLAMAGLFLVVVAKRLTSNKLRSTGVPVPRLMMNRLLYDRDIADHDEWVRRDPTGPA